jgi:uncharacterized protein YbjT (DUF2867 family)
MMILVTAATGNVGPRVARELLGDSGPVRGFARNPAKAAGMLGNGVELAAGDFSNATARQDRGGKPASEEEMSLATTLIRS